MASLLPSGNIMLFLCRNFHPKPQSCIKPPIVSGVWESTYKPQVRIHVSIYRCPLFNITAPTAYNLTRNRYRIFLNLKPERNDVSISFLWQEIQGRDEDATYLPSWWAVLESNQLSLRHLIYSQARFHIRYTDPYKIELKKVREPSLYIIYSPFIRLLRRQVWAPGSYPNTSCPSRKRPKSQRGLITSNFHPPFR